jgi:error-prone DNA polymerase
MTASYTELQTTTNYSFLRGASHIEEIVAQASILGFSALAVTDHNTLAGIVRAHRRAQETKIRLIIGCRLDLTDNNSILVYPTDRAAYTRLCHLLTLGKSRAGKGTCHLTWSDMVAHGEGLIAILCTSLTLENLQRLKADFGDRAYAALTLQRRPNDALRLQQIVDLACAAHVPVVTTGDVLYHLPQRRILQDVLTCIREGCTIDDAGFRREPSADRHLKSPEAMVRLFALHSDAITRTLEIADRCHFSLDELRYQYPHEVRTHGLTAQQTLEQLTWSGAPRRYPEGVPENVSLQLRHELALIAELQYAPYFLTVESIMRFAKSRGILCQGRGSAANSTVCYVLGITSINPMRSGLLFERFISAERKEPPDIDMDFEHERREEVIQWVYNTYGRDHAAICATVIRYRGRGAIRDVGKALGLTEDVSGALATQVSHWGEDGIENERVAELNLNMEDRRLRLTLDLARTLIGFPRHLSQHPGGFVLTQDRLDDLVPIEPARMADRQVIEWDKDDIDFLRFIKVDVLGLGMLGCLRRAFDLLEKYCGQRLDLDSIPPEDTATYEMICRADTLGTFQIESRAQMSMLPRLRPRTFYDIVIQVAIVRPGPIQGDMVHPYLRRREGIEKAEYPNPELRCVLEKTLGIPLFQEQAMQVAIVCAGFTPSEADALRRSMATFKFTGGVHHFRDKMIAGMCERGYTEEFAKRTFSQIEGFGSYGFPESHAASFALIAYASSWLKCHHPDVFCCAVLNAQPMGFYAPAQIVRDAQLHGVEIRPICINTSDWDCTLEQADGDKLAVRLGLCMVKDLARVDGNEIVAQRGVGLYCSIEDIWRRVRVSVAALERVAEADAFGSLGLSRRQALWVIRGLSDALLPLFGENLRHAAMDAEIGNTLGEAAALPSSAIPRLDLPRSAGEVFLEPQVILPPSMIGREVIEDYRSTGLSLRRHPVFFLRSDLRSQCIVTCADLANTRDGQHLTVAGIVLVRQRPGSARGVLFVTIEDETGHANLIVWPTIFSRQRRLVLTASIIACRGKVQREGEVIHIVANHLTDLSDLLRGVGQRGEDFLVPLSRADHIRRSGDPDPHETPSRVPQHEISSIKVPTRNFR